MTKRKRTTDKDRTLDLENSLDKHLFSKIKHAENFKAPNLSKEEFRKLWSKEKGYKNFDQEGDPDLRKTVDNTSVESQIVQSPHISPDSNTGEHSTTQRKTLNSNNLLALILDCITRKSESVNDENRGPVKNRTELHSLTRVVRVPLNAEMEDKLIRIRRKLNELLPIEKDEDIIEDFQVLQALLEIVEL